MARTAARDVDFLRAFLTAMPVHRALVRATEARLFATYVPDLPEPIGDIGSGDGSFSEIVFPGRRIIGIDRQPGAAREAARRGNYCGVGVASSAELPFRDGCFASVISNCVLEHIAPLEATLREVVRVLRPGGQFVATVVGNRFPHDLLGSALLRTIGHTGHGYGAWFNRISQHVHTLSRDEWGRQFAGAGLEVLFHRPYLNAVALKLFDLSHYAGAPSLLTRRTTGRWLLAPPVTPNLLWEPLLRPHYEAPPGEDGPYYFFICRRGA